MSRINNTKNFVADDNTITATEDIRAVELYDDRVDHDDSVDHDDPAERAGRLTKEFCRGKLVIAKGCEYSLDDMETRLNNNVLIVGGSGTGKTRFIVTPNIHAAVGSYFICDPKGQLCKRYSGYLKRKGYDVRLIDFTHPERSDGYNPMDYIKSTQDILKLSAVIVDAKESEGSASDPYWDRMTTLLICAIIGYLHEAKKKQASFRDILDLVRKGERRDDTDKSSELQSIFIRHKKLHPNSWACEKFEAVDTAPYKTFDTIRSTLMAKFSHLDTEELRQMMSRSGFDFAQTAQRRVAVFVTVSDTDRTMDVLANLFFTQAMNELCTYADDRCEGGRLPVPVRFILDDFATNCRIEEFPRMISSIRSRALSVMLMIQSEAQLSQGYGHDAATVISNCDTYVYLGGNDVKTAQSVAERCDSPLRDVLYMPVGSCRVFRRGSDPKYAQLAEVEECIREMEI